LIENSNCQTRLDILIINLQNYYENFNYQVNQDLNVKICSFQNFYNYKVSL